MQAFIDFLRKLFEHRIMRHIAFWLLMMVIAILLNYMWLEQTHHISSLENLKLAVLRNSFNAPVIITAAYLLLYYQIPTFIYRHQYLNFVIHFLFFAYLFGVLLRAINIYAYEPFIKAPGFTQEPIDEILIDMIAIYKSYFFRIYTVPLIMVILKLIKDRFEEKQHQQLLEKEKLTAELSFLRAQIHPHFLFNTLNNLYLLTLKKSDKAPETVIKLSEIMDYMLYQCNEPTVPIEKELKLLENYIGLEMLRYGDRLSLNFEKSIDNPQKKIAPLLLLSLVENAFKHGVSSDIGEPKVEIGLILVENSLNLRVFNTKSAIVQQDERQYKKGIGMSNTKRQLELTYPGQHRMVIEEKETAYMVDLFIDLNLENA